MKWMPSFARLGANHSNSTAIARICNDAWRTMAPFHVNVLAKRSTSIQSAADPTPYAENCSAWPDCTLASLES